MIQALLPLASSIASWEAISRLLPWLGRWLFATGKEGAKGLGENIAKKAAGKAFISAADSAVAGQAPRLGKTVAGWMGSSPVSSAIGKMVPAAAAVTTIGAAMHGSGAINDLLFGREGGGMDTVADIPISQAQTVSDEDQARQIGTMMTQAQMRDLMAAIEEYTKPRSRSI